MDQLSPLTDVATLKIVVECLRSLFQEEFATCVRTQKAAGALPHKRALLLYKVLGEIASLTDRLFTHQHDLLDAGRSGQPQQGFPSAVAEVGGQLDKELRHLAAAVRAIHPAWSLKPQQVSDALTPWVNGSVDAQRFLVDLRWDSARRPGSAANWQQAVSARLADLLMELNANHRQIQEGIAALRGWLMAEFAFSEEFFPK